MNTSELKLRMLSGSICMILGCFSALVIKCLMGATAADLDGGARIFIGMTIMAIFLNVWLHYAIKDLEKKDEDEGVRNEHE